MSEVNENTIPYTVCLLEKGNKYKIVVLPPNTSTKIEKEIPKRKFESSEFFNQISNGLNTIFEEEYIKKLFNFMNQ
jgi:hypothetical protein